VPQDARGTRTHVDNLVHDMLPRVQDVQHRSSVSYVLRRAREILRNRCRRSGRRPRIAIIEEHGWHAQYEVRSGKRRVMNARLFGEPFRLGLQIYRCGEDARTKIETKNRRGIVAIAAAKAAPIIENEVVSYNSQQRRIEVGNLRKARKVGAPKQDNVRREHCPARGA
jgi:hypothetical protein